VSAVSFEEKKKERASSGVLSNLSLEQGEVG
jgi:hypothetical protein